MLESLDEHLLLWVHGLVGKLWLLDYSASSLANDFLVPVSVALICFGLWFTGANAAARRRNQWGLVYGVLGVVLSAAVIAIANHFYFRDRPYVRFPQIAPDVDRLFYRPTVSSFPSYPAAITFALGAGIWIENKTAGVALFLLAALMALGRVYVGVHYPSDVIVGGAIGVGATALCFQLRNLLAPIGNFGFRLLESIFLA